MVITTALAAATASEPVAFIDISRHRNNLACTTTETLEDGRLNVWRNSLPQPELPTGDTLTVAGIPFVLPTFDGVSDDNVVCAGQHVACQPGRYDWLYLLATAERRCEDVVGLRFVDGSADLESIRVSDMWHSRPAFGERQAFGTEQMHYTFHVQPNLRGEVYFLRVPITRMTPLVGLTLPENVALHVFAASLVPSRLELEEQTDA